MSATRASERLEQYSAIANALACAFKKEGAPLPESLRNDMVAAYLTPPE